MNAFEIHGGKPLKGEIVPQGAKNEALQILSAVLLTEEKMIDAKLEGIFSAWGYEVPTVQGAFIKTIIEF